jgi:hypothetical protein
MGKETYYWGHYWVEAVFVCANYIFGSVSKKYRINSRIRGFFSNGRSRTHSPCGGFRRYQRTRIGKFGERDNGG